MLLQAFESFDRSSLAALEISQEELLLKLRLTALMALSSKSHVVSFQAVQQALDLQSNAEVEQWIVRAIGKVGLECLSRVSAGRCISCGLGSDANLQQWTVQDTGVVGLGEP